MHLLSCANLYEGNRVSTIDTAAKENDMGLVKTRRLAAMQKQQRAILLCQGYGGLKAGMKPPVKKGGALPPHLYKSGGKPAAEVPRF